MWLLAPLPSVAQSGTEWQVHSLALLGADRFLGGGVGLNLRTNGRMRWGAALNAGELEGNVALRPEVLGSFHLNPYKRRGVAPYAGAGVALVISEGTTREYILAVIGVESRPGRSRGWFAEVGVGGGARVSVGVQFRKQHARVR